METTNLLPIEVSEIAVKVSEQKQQEVITILNQIFTGTNDWEKQVDAIEVKDINDNMSIQLADTARKNAKNARLNAEKIFDQKRAEVQQVKAEYDIEDKLWLKAKQVMQIKFKAIEEKAEWKANFVKRYEAEQKELRTQKRILEVNQYSDSINRIEFENMSNESYDVFLNGLKTTYEAKIEAEKKAEQERIAKEKAEQEEREKQRLENIRLKEEAEKREKEIEIERKKQAELLEKQEAKAKEEARIEAEKQAKIQQELRIKAEKERIEKERIEKELKAKQLAEAEEIGRRNAEIIKAQKEAEKLAKAPIKKQLLAWVSSFSISEPTISNEKSLLIKQKFDSFKKWAENEINSI